MLSDIIKIRNKMQPHSPNNQDAVQFDYMFFTDLERTAKDCRKKALDTLKQVSKHPDREGVILTGAVYETILEKSKPRRSFDKEVFLELIKEAFPEIPTHKLRECATKAVVDGSISRTYKTRPIGEKKDD